MPRRSTAFALALCALSFLALLTVAAFAQSAPALVQPTATGGWDLTPLLDELQRFVMLVFVGVLTGGLALLLKPVNKYLGTHIEAQEIVKDMKMGDYAKRGVREALAWAKQQTGLTDEQLKDVQLRNPVLSLAAGFLFKQYPEVWSWVANQEKGVMQYIEAELPPEAALPPNVVEGVGPVPLTQEAKS